MIDIDDDLFNYATDREKELLIAYKHFGNPTDAGRECGTAATNVSRALRKCKEKRDKENQIASCNGYQPPVGFSTKKISAYIDEDGVPKRQWIQSFKDIDDTLAGLKLAVEDIIEPIKGAYVPTVGDMKDQDDEILCVYPIADIHLGLYSWGEETGTDWDSDKCSETLYKFMRHLIRAAPPAKTALIANLADFFHCDSNSGQTARSGHKLDVDTRWARVFRIGVTAFRQMIELALEKHEKVIVKSAIGNHDDNTGVALSMMMEAYFTNEPRVEVHVPINPFAYYRFGKTLLGLNHNVKPDRLPLIMAADECINWGETRWHHWLCGHVHHKSFYEFPGCTVETFRSPSAKDNWSHSMGYRSERTLVAQTYHITEGKIGEIIKTIF